MWFSSISQCAVWLEIFCHELNTAMPVEVFFTTCITQQGLTTVSQSQPWHPSVRKVLNPKSSSEPSSYPESFQVSLLPRPSELTSDQSDGKIFFGGWTQNTGKWIEKTWDMEAWSVSYCDSAQLWYTAYHHTALAMPCTHYWRNRWSADLSLQMYQ